MAIVPDSTIGGRYRTKRMLGKGNMGEVWLALDVELKRPVAIKFILPEQRGSEPIERFRAEMVTLSQLRGPFVARLLHSGEHDGAPYMVMEFVEGKNLAELLESGVTLPVEEAVDYVVQAAFALHEAHGKNIVHRDLKPANLHVDSHSGQIKVLDFGVAKAAQALRPKMTADRSFIGTLAYSSPEQLKDSANVGPASDLWSLGVILYELLARTPPFPQDSVQALCDAITYDPPPPLRELRPELEAGLEEVILCCLEKDASARYADAADLVRALAPFGGEESRALAGRVTRVGLGFSSELELEPLGHAATEYGERVSLPVAHPGGTEEIPRRDAARTEPRVRTPERPSFGSASALIEKLLASSRRGKNVVFMLGAGFSVPDDDERRNGVPGAADMVERVLEYFRKSNPRDALELEQRLADSPNRYLTAFTFLTQYDLTEVANDLLRQAVLGAYDGDESEPRKCEQDHARWRMPTGVRGLGEIIARSKANQALFAPFARMLLTTNFDPLLSVAAAQRNSLCVPLSIGDDGNLPKLHDTTCTLFHLHGRWDSGDTFHTNLSAGRPRLESSLRDSLKNSVLVVLGYGGWRDVFMSALEKLLKNPSDGLEVLWAFYDNDPDRIVREQPHILRLRQIGSRIHFYNAVNTNDLFRDLIVRIRELGGYPSTFPAPSASGRRAQAVVVTWALRIAAATLALVLAVLIVVSTLRPDQKVPAQAANQVATVQAAASKPSQGGAPPITTPERVESRVVKLRLNGKCKQVKALQLKAKDGVLDDDSRNISTGGLCEIEVKLRDGSSAPQVEVAFMPPKFRGQSITLNGASIDVPLEAIPVDPTTRSRVATATATGVATGSGGAPATITTTPTTQSATSSGATCAYYLEQCLAGCGPANTKDVIYLNCKDDCLKRTKEKCP